MVGASEPVRVERDGARVLVTIDRRHRRNAVDVVTLQRLADELDALADAVSATDDADVDTDAAAAAAADTTSPVRFDGSETSRGAAGAAAGGTTAASATGLTSPVHVDGHESPRGPGGAAAIGEAAVSTAGATSPVRVVVLTGAPPAFCAGADLTGVKDDVFAAALTRVLTGLVTLPVPVIAAIDGPALGAGTQLAIACDLRVATPASRFGIPAARLGLMVDQWTVRRLREQFTPAVATAMLVAAETYTADRLATIGAVHRLGDLDAALAWADDLAALAPLTVSGHKLAGNRLSAAGIPIELALDDAVEAARRTAWASADAAEGPRAFADKRAPRFTGC